MYSWETKEPKNNRTCLGKKSFGRSWWNVMLDTRDDLNEEKLTTPNKIHSDEDGLDCSKLWIGLAILDKIYIYKFARALVGQTNVNLLSLCRVNRGQNQ